MSRAFAAAVLPAFFRSGSFRPRAVALLIGAHILIIGLLVFVGMVFVENFDSAVRNRNTLNDSFERRWQIEHILSTMQDTETGQRGYVITGKPEFLEPYANAMA